MMKLFSRVKNKIHILFERNGNKQIIHLTYFYALIFVALIIYILIFTYRDSDRIINNSYNKREALYEKNTIRGSILSKDGEVLAYTDVSSGYENRVYPYGPVFAHVVGYNSNGKSGIESIANFSLLRSNTLFTEKITNDINGIKNLGDNIVTTLDLKTQYAAYNALGDRRGAIVVMDANNGYILAMVSKPDFDPNQIVYLWDDIINSSEKSALLNRCTQGLYPPGSTFKIVTALEYINENSNTDNYDFDCNGSFEYKGTRINCYHGTAHGEMSFESAFAKSCNSSFANITTYLNKNEFEDTCEELLFNENIPSPLLVNNTSSMYVNKSFVPINKNSTSDELIQTGIGQGKTTITPYHMCLISSAIANDGILMTPIIVKEIENTYGDHVSSCTVRPYKRLITSNNSVKLKGMMRQVITEGTGTKLLNSLGYTAYGKTGSAEFSSNKTESHAWFTGFAEGDNGASVAISVIVENGGSGGQVAVPIAREVFDTYFN